MKGVTPVAKEEPSDEKFAIVNVSVPKQQNIEINNVTGSNEMPEDNDIVRLLYAALFLFY